MADAEQYWWCTRHGRVEGDDTTCRAKDRYGPYESEEAARNWRDRFAANEDRWEAQDEAWDGTS